MHANGDDMCYSVWDSEDSEVVHAGVQIFAAEPSI